MSWCFRRAIPPPKTRKHMKKHKTTTTNETAREAAPETTANELPTEIAAMPREERDRLLAALMAQRKADKLAAKKPPKLRMRKLERCCLWVDKTLYEAFKAWAEENAKDKTMELAGNLLIAEAIGWAIPEGFIAAPKPKTADKEETAKS